MGRRGWSLVINLILKIYNATWPAKCRFCGRPHKTEDCPALPRWEYFPYEFRTDWYKN